MTPTLAVTRDESTSLRDLLDGEIVMPGDPAWDKARLAWNLAADQRPAAVVFVESVDDVVAVVDYARANGLRVAAQGTGHFANSLDSLADTILVKTVRMRGVEIDPEARTARVEAGVLWEEVALAAAEHGARRARRLLPPTSASSDTRSAVASAGSPAATDSPPTASSPPSS